MSTVATGPQKSAGLYPDIDSLQVAQTSAAVEGVELESFLHDTIANKIAKNRSFVFMMFGFSLA
ncbi:MAG: hypothetical protein ACOYN4_17515 [Bacteroidales bacterium]